MVAITLLILLSYSPNGTLANHAGIIRCDYIFLSIKRLLQMRDSDLHRADFKVDCTIDNDCTVLGIDYDKDASTGYSARSV